MSVSGRRAPVWVMILAAMLSATTASVISSCSTGCQKVHLDATSVVVPDVTSPITLSARLRIGSQPGPGIRLTFIVLASGPNREGSQLAGYATTSQDGIAVFRSSGGVAELVLPGEKVAGYRVTLVSAVRVHGKSLCTGSASASLTVAQ